MNDHRVPFEDYDEWLALHQPAGAGGYYGSGVMHNDWTAKSWHMDESLQHTNWAPGLALDDLRKRDPTLPFSLCVSFPAAHSRAPSGGYPRNAARKVLDIASHRRTM